MNDNYSKWAQDALEVMASLEGVKVANESSPDSSNDLRDHLTYDSNMTKNQADSWHGPASEAIRAHKEGDHGRLIDLPKGITNRGDTAAPASTVVKNLNLGKFT